MIVSALYVLIPGKRSNFKWRREGARREVSDAMGERWYLDGVSLSQLEESVLSGRNGTSDAVSREGWQPQAHSPSRGHNGRLAPAAVSGSHSLCLDFRAYHIRP